MKFRFLLIAVAMIVIIPTVGWSQEPSVQTVTAEGVAGLTGVDKAQSRDQAINDALRKAVEQAVGTLISSETMVENYQVLSDSVYSRTHGYVRTYEIIDEKTTDGLYYVTVRAQVASEALKGDLAALGLLMARKNMPRVMMMVAEQNVGSTYYTYWWSVFAGKAERMGEHADLTITENTLMEILNTRGFHVIDPAVPAKNATVGAAYSVQNLSNQAIKQIGNMAGAEIVIYGKALAKLAGNVHGSSMQSAQADISLRAVRTDSGQVIASATRHGAAVHPNEVTAGTEAIRATTTEMAEALIEQLMQRWGQDVAGKAMVRVSVRGITEYDHLVQFKTGLRNSVRGVSGIYQRSFESGLAVLDVELSGDAQWLADKITGLTFQGFRVTVVDVTQNTLRVQAETTER